MANAQDTFDEGFEKPRAKMFSAGLPGDAFKGTLLSVKPFAGAYGPTRVYEFRGIAGSYHPIVNTKEVSVKEEDIAKKEAKGYVVLKKEEAVTAGESYVIFERKTFAEDIHSAVVGQKVVIRYVEDRTSKAGTEYKYVVAKLGAMDEAAEKVDVGDAF